MEGASEFQRFKKESNNSESQGQVMVCSQTFKTQTQTQTHFITAISTDKGSGGTFLLMSLITCLFFFFLSFFWIMTLCFLPLFSRRLRRQCFLFFFFFEGIMNTCMYTPVYIHTCKYECGYVHMRSHAHGQLENETKT
jgi:hypothetical protein